MNDTLTARDRREIKLRIRALEEQIEELQWAIDDAADEDDGERWEVLNDRLEYRQANLDELHTLLREDDEPTEEDDWDGTFPCGCSDYHYADCPTRGGS